MTEVLFSFCEMVVIPLVISIIGGLITLLISENYKKRKNDRRKVKDDH